MLARSTTCKERTRGRSAGMRNSTGFPPSRENPKPYRRPHCCRWLKISILSIPNHFTRKPILVLPLSEIDAINISSTCAFTEGNSMGTTLGGMDTVRLRSGRHDILHRLNITSSKSLAVLYASTANSSIRMTHGCTGSEGCDPGHMISSTQTR